MTTSKILLGFLRQVEASNDLSLYTRGLACNLAKFIELQESADEAVGNDIFDTILDTMVAQFELPAHVRARTQALLGAEKRLLDYLTTCPIGEAKAVLADLETVDRLLRADP